MRSYTRITNTKRSKGVYRGTKWIGGSNRLKKRVNRTPKYKRKAKAGSHYSKELSRWFKRYSRKYLE